MAQTITIDGVEHDLESLSDAAKSHINSLQLADQKMAQLRTELAMMQTARNAYAEALKSELVSAESASE